MKRIKKLFYIVILTGISLLFILNTASSQETAGQLFEKALYLEEGKGELQPAIELYQQILDQYSEDREVAAKSLLHLGICYEKLGLKQARETYQDVINKYPDRKGEVALAKERLNRLLALQDVPHKPNFRKLRIPTKLSWVMQLSPDGKKVVFTSDKKLWIMPLSGKLGSEFLGNPIILNINDVEVDWSGLAWSGDGKWIAFNKSYSTREWKEQEGNQGMYIVSAEGGRPKKVYENYRDARIVNYKISLSPDGKMLAFSSVDSNECHINTISVDGGMPRQLVDAQAREPVFSPDGKMIAYVDTKNLGRAGGGLWVIPASNGTPKRVVNAGNASSPTWSPDGDMIAFLDDQQICIVPVGEDGAASGEVNKIDVPDGTGGIMFLAGWTPENRIGAVFRSHTEFGLYTLQATGGKAALVSHGGYPAQPRWSPDGDKIFHTNKIDEGSGDWERLSLAVVPADGGKVKTVPIQFDEKMIKPAWGGGNEVSPDSKRIAFNYGAEKYAKDIRIISIDDGNIVDIKTGLVDINIYHLDWSSDGDRFVFSGYQGDTPEFWLMENFLPE